MWTYSQSSGDIAHDGQLVGTGYAGHDVGKNKPEMQAVHLVGPLPRGAYFICPAHTDPKLGPVAMALIPAPDNQMFGRSAFYIHADSASHPGAASEGCIVLSLPIWQRIAASPDHQLVVTL